MSAALQLDQQMPLEGCLLTVLVTARWFHRQGIRTGLTRVRKGHWVITPRT